MSESSERPIFIVGVHRSGTTLLRYMLSSHPRIHVPQESDFIPYFFLGDPQEQLSPERVAAVLDIIFERYRFTDEWQSDPPDATEFYEEMGGRTPSAFLDTLYGRYARQNSAVRWGDKTPIYASYVDLISEIFPDAQFLHIIRDARDAALSMLDKYEQDELHVDIFFAARNWVRRIRRAQRDGLPLGPERFYELRYEDLVQDPEGQLRGICEYLGEAFEPQMVRFDRLARERVPQDSHFFATVREPLDTSKVGRWRREMSEADQRLVQRVAGGLMAELGYQLCDLGPSRTAENLRLAALAAKYGILQAGRRVLQEAGLFPPI